MAVIYLHIGMSKAGSTTIQRFMWDNREILKQNDICCPDLPFRYPGVSCRRNGHFLIAPSKNRKQDSEASLSEYEKGLDELAELGKEYSRIFLSDEGFWSIGFQRKNFWKNLKDELEKRNLSLKIIMYLRRQDLWIQSSWAQKIKKGFIKRKAEKSGCTVTFQEYLKRIQKKGYPLDYCSCADQLAGVFGKDHLIIRAFEKKQFQGNDHTLQSDLLDIFGLELTEDFVVSKDSYNQRLDESYLEMKRILNFVPEFWTGKNALIKSFQLIHRQNPFFLKKGKPSFFRKGEQKAFLELYASSNSRLAREYLGRETGILFYDDVTESPKRESKEKLLLRSVILTYGCTLNSLLQGNTELRISINQLSDRQKKLENSLKKMESSLKKLQNNSFRSRLKRKLSL